MRWQTRLIVLVPKTAPKTPLSDGYLHPMLSRTGGRRALVSSQSSGKSCHHDTIGRLPSCSLALPAVGSASRLFCS